MVGAHDDPETYRRARADRAVLIVALLTDTANTNIAMTVRAGGARSPGCRAGELSRVGRYPAPGRVRSRPATRRPARPDHGPTGLRPDGTKPFRGRGRRSSDCRGRGGRDAARGAHAERPAPARTLQRDCRWRVGTRAVHPGRSRYGRDAGYGSAAGGHTSAARIAYDQAFGYEAVAQPFAVIIGGRARRPGGGPCPDRTGHRLPHRRETPRPRGEGGPAHRRRRCGRSGSAAGGGNRSCVGRHRDHPRRRHECVSHAGPVGVFIPNCSC